MILLAGTLLAGLVIPHLWPRRWLSPATGISLWLGLLALRAVMAALGVVLLVLYLPATQLFQLVTHWCFHAVLPLLTVHFGFSGHSLGDAALLVPALALTLSVVWAVFASWRTARAVAAWARSSSLGKGPRESVVVGGSEVLVAAAGLRRPRVVVSAGALAQLDDEELAAGLEHEWGHIRRRHRFVTLAGQMLLSFARLLPGSRRAFDELHFHLERDADEYAVRRTGDPLALASAICKSALGGIARPVPLLAALAGSAGRARLDPLLHRGRRPGRLARGGGMFLAASVPALALTLVLSAPTIASVGFEQLASSSLPHYCD